MKKKLIISIVVALVIVAGIATVIAIRTYSIAQKRQQREAAQQSSTASPTVSREGVDMCKLIPASKASEIIGVTVTADEQDELSNGTPKIASLSTQSSCNYKGEDSLASVSMVSHTPGTDVSSSNYPAEEYNTRKSDASDKVAVSGLGDDAYWVPSSASLVVRKNNSYYTFSVLLSDEASQQAKAEQLAKAALAAL